MMPIAYIGDFSGKPYCKETFEMSEIALNDFVQKGDIVLFDTNGNTECYGTGIAVHSICEYEAVNAKKPFEEIVFFGKRLSLSSSQLSEKLVEYTKKNVEISRELAKYKTQASEYERKYNEIQNAFYWRIFSPVRLLTHKIKKTVFGTPWLCNLYMDTKLLLRSGPKAVFSVRKKRKQLRIEKKLYLSGKISAKRRNEEENYKFSRDIKFSIVVPLYNTPKDFLVEMINSVTAQTYKNFELCLADGSSDEFAYIEKYCNELAARDKRIKYKKIEKNEGISGNTNECIKMSSGEYIALFDHDDVLHPSALFEYAKAICEQDADFIYCDEDKFTKSGKYFDAHFKPDFSIDNLRANNYICHFTVFKKSLLDTVGMFRDEFNGSQDHDIILRLTEKAEKIVHIPRVLYHWRISDASVASDPYAKPYTITAGINAVSEHLKRSGLRATVESTKAHPNIYKINYEIIGNPLVSIIIPNYNHIEELSRCIESIINLSTYTNYEIIIIENNSNQQTFDYYDTLKKYSNIKVVVYKPEPNEFNYSAINNFGFRFAKGEHIILLNNDVEIITPDWIEQMLMYSQREDVGAVGAKLYYPNDTVQHAGAVIGILSIAGHAFRTYPRSHPGYFGRLCYAQNVSAVTAACVMMKSSIFREINGLDETFKVAFNDMDMCLRIREKGYLIVFTPFCELYHYESVSRGIENTPEKLERFWGEIALFKSRWGDILEKGDPYYNPNLTLESEDYSPKYQ